MKQMTDKITTDNLVFESREDYKDKTNKFLTALMEEDRYKNNDVQRRMALESLLVILYDDLMKRVDEATSSESDAINDDAIEGILAIANMCIEERHKKQRNPEPEMMLETDLRVIMEDRDVDVKARVNAFYSLCTKSRRMKDFKEFRKLIDDREDEVGKDVIFKIMRAYYYIQETARDLDPQRALGYWKGSIPQKYKRLPAFTQIYTETVVLQCEESAKDERSKEEDDMLQESELLISKAIEEREYPKFYSTLGRIYCCKEEYDKGVTEVRKAITAEDSRREDYWSRLNEYQGLISRFQRKKDEKKLREDAGKIREELEKTKTNYISILGFFSAIMALIIGGINTANGARSMIESFQLLIGVAGLIIISFGSLNLMLTRKDDRQSDKYAEWTLFVIGGGLFVVAFLVGMMYRLLETHGWI